MSPEEILKASHERLMAGDARGAEVILAELWNAGDPKPTKAMHLLALIRRTQNRLLDAEALLRGALARAPQDGEIRLALAELLRVAGAHAAAIPEFEALFAMGPAPALARVGYALSLIAIGRGEEAERQARAVLQAKPDSVDAARALAGALGLQMKRDEALGVLDAALRAAQSPPSRRALELDRAGALHRAGRTDEAIATYARLAALAPLPPAAFAGWAQAHFDAGDAVAAEQRLKEALALEPGHAGLHADLIHLRWMRGEALEVCVADARRALANHPDNHGLRESMILLIAQMGDAEGAEREIRAALALAPQHRPFHSLLGHLQDERGALRDAIATLEHAMSLGGDAETEARFAHALLRVGQPARALPQIAAMLKRTPNDQFARALAATAYRQQNDPRFAQLYDLQRFVSVTDLAPPPGYSSMDAFNAALAVSLERLHGLARHPLNQTLRDGTQTARDLTEENDPHIQAFLALSKAAVQRFVASLPDDATHPFLARKRGDVRYAGAWSVRLRAGGRHVNHVHPKGWISSAYYVRAPSVRAGDAPRAGWLKFGEPRLPMPGCEALSWVEPKPGRLALFPSYMWHGTEPFTHDDRLTIAFDMVPA